MHVIAVADSPDRARAALATVGWPRSGAAAILADAARRARRSSPTTRRPPSRTRRPRSSSTRPAIPPPASPTRGCRDGKHVVMVNVEADALAGPLLARARAAEAGIVYSLAYGDQPALICEMVDWARAAGFDSRRGGQGHEVPAGLSRVDARRPCGATTASAPRRRAAAASTRRCSIRSSTARRRRSRWRRWRTPPGSRRARAALRSRRAASDDLPRVLRPRARGGSARSGGAGRGLEPRARRPAGVPRPALGRVRRSGADRTTSRAASTNTASSPTHRPVRGDVQAVSPDRPRARHQRGVGVGRSSAWWRRERRNGTCAAPPAPRRGGPVRGSRNSSPSAQGVAADGRPADRPRARRAGWRGR